MRVALAARILFTSKGYLYSPRIMKPDTSSSFEYRLEQWISKQGLFFLIANGRVGVSLVSSLMGVLFRLIILTLIAIVIAWFFLKQRPETEAFKEDLIQQVSDGMNASDVEIRSITRVNGGILSGDMYIKSLKLGETENSFFKNWRISERKVNVDRSRTDVDIEDVTSLNGVTMSPLNIGDNYITGWSASQLDVNSMTISLKTGGDTDEQAREIYGELFRKYDSLNIKSISVNEGTVFWGGSQLTMGSIKDAQFDILRNKDSWEMNISGGRFSYAWLKDVELQSMKLTCDASDKIRIEKAVVALGEGSLTFNVDIEVCAQPKVKGDYSFERVGVIDLIGEEYENWLSGEVKGDGTFIGNLNSAEGIVYDTTVRLKANPRSKEEAESSIFINGNKLKILEVIQSIDQYNSYSKIKAYEGEIKLKYQELVGISNVTLNDIRCGIDGLILMNGEFQHSENDDIPVSVEEESNEKQFSGEIKMGFLPRVFQSNTAIIEVFKIDDVVLRTQLDVDVEGQIHQLTSKMGEKLEEISIQTKK